MKRKAMCLFVVLALFVSGGLFAQNTTDLRFGSVISGNLNPEQEIWYRVTATENCMVIVETLGSTDTYLEAYDAQRNLIVENDDGGGDSNARVQFFVARGSSYLIKLRTFGSYSSGPFRILASTEPVPTATTLGIGSVLSGNIAAGGNYWYSVQTRERGVLVVETTSSIDTFLEAYNSSYVLITSNDDGGEGYNARVEVFVQPNQTYYFKLTGLSTDTTGSYRILSSISPMPAATALSIGSVLSGNIAPGENYWYSVQARETGILIVETIGSTDTYLEAYNSSYVQLTYNDDGADQNARVEVQAQANQTYYFRLRGYSTDVTGPYRILATIERGRQ